MSNFLTFFFFFEFCTHLIYSTNIFLTPLIAHLYTWTILSRETYTMNITDVSTASVECPAAHGEGKTCWRAGLVPHIYHAHLSCIRGGDGNGFM